MEPEYSLPHSQVPASWARSIQSITPHPTSWRSILILSSHLYLGLPSAFSYRFSPHKPVYTSLSPIHATCPDYLILDLITRTISGEQYRSLSSSLCSFLHSPDTSSLLDPNLSLSTLFSNTLSLRSSLSVSDMFHYTYNIYLDNTLHVSAPNGHHQPRINRKCSQSDCHLIWILPSTYKSLTTAHRVTNRSQVQQSQLHISPRRQIGEPHKGKEVIVGYNYI